jgi:hypothetical protein
MRNIVIASAAVMALVACGGGDEVDRLVGARCEADVECDDRCLEPSNDYPDGFCTLDCDTTGDCPVDTDCIDLEGGVCLFICFDNADCNFLGPNWICAEENLREDTNTKVAVCRGD